VGAASSRDGMIYGGVVCFTNAHSRSIDSGDRGRTFERGCGGKPGELFSDQRKVEAPDALCAAGHPVCGAGRFYPVGSRASSGLEPCDLLNKHASGPSPCGCPVAWPSPRSRSGVSCMSRARSATVSPSFQPRAESDRRRWRLRCSPAPHSRHASSRRN